MTAADRPVVRVVDPGRELLAGRDVLAGHEGRRWPSRSRSAGVGLAVVAGLLALGAVRAVPSSSPVPVPAPVVRTPAAPAPDRDDLTTTVSEARVRLPAGTVEEQVAAVSQALSGTTGLVASYYYLLPSPDGEGVQVLFERRLSAAGSQALLAAAARLPAATAEVLDVPGTTVDVWVPLAPGAPCAGDDGLVLSAADEAVVARVFRVFRLSASAGRASVGYRGPALSGAQLREVGAALVRSCGVPPASVGYSRGAPDPG